MTEAIQYNLGDRVRVVRLEPWLEKLYADAVHNRTGFIGAFSFSRKRMEIMARVVFDAAEMPAEGLKVSDMIMPLTWLERIA